MKEDKDTNLFDLLIIFFRWIGRCFNRLFAGIGWCLQLSFQHLVLTIIICALGIAIGIFFSQPERRYYNVEGLAVLNGPSADITKEISKQLEWTLPQAIHNEQNLIQQQILQKAKSAVYQATLPTVSNEWRHSMRLTTSMTVRLIKSTLTTSTT